MPPIIPQPIVELGEAVVIHVAGMVREAVGEAAQQVVEQQRNEIMGFWEDFKEIVSDPALSPKDKLQATKDLLGGFCEWIKEQAKQRMPEFLKTVWRTFSRKIGEALDVVVDGLKKVLSKEHRAASNVKSQLVDLLSAKEGGLLNPALLGQIEEKLGQEKRQEFEQKIERITTLVKRNDLTRPRDLQQVHDELNDLSNWNEKFFGKNNEAVKGQVGDIISKMCIATSLKAIKRDMKAGQTQGASTSTPPPARRPSVVTSHNR